MGESQIHQIQMVNKHDFHIHREIISLHVYILLLHTLHADTHILENILRNESIFI